MWLKFLLIVFILTGFLFSEQVYCYEGADYWDSTMTLLVGLNDTLKAMAVFSYARDGLQNDTMKVMFPWTS